jgi:hypothetical protein
MRITWDEIDGIMMRAVARGMARRQKDIVRFIGIDEKSIRKRHKYFTIVSDLQTQKVLWIGRGRKRETIDSFWKTLSEEQLAGIEGISMDMWVRRHKPAWSQTVKARYDEGLAKPHQLRAVRAYPRGYARSVGRGMCRPAIEPRKTSLQGADVVHMTEGNTKRRVNASATFGPAWSLDPGMHRCSMRGSREGSLLTTITRGPCRKDEES